MVKQDGDTEIFSSIQAGPEYMPDHVDGEPKALNHKEEQANAWMRVAWIAIVIAAFAIGLVIGLMM